MKRLIFVLMVVASTIGCLITIQSVSAQTPGVTGFPICTNSSTQTDPVIDGYIVVWLDQRSGHIHLYGYDLSTATEFPICTTGYQQGRAGISGDIVVWEELRNGTNDIYGYNISTGVEFPICTEPTMPQVFPAISGEIVVWEDERNGDGNGDIYAYNLSSGVEFPICTNASVQMGSDISGNIVVWTDTRNGKEDIYGYNLSNGVEFPICTNASYQWNAAISGDIVVWYDNRWEEYYSDVYGYNLSSGTEFPVIVASSSGQYAPDVSGDVVVWYDTRTGNYDIYGATLNWNPPSQVWVDDDYSLGYCGGHTWGYDAFNKIQDGINAVSGSTVHVAAGTYYENIVLKDGVELLGAGSATTIIDGMQSGSVITANNVGNNTILDGFTATNGSNDNGGGICNYNASPIITNCIFQNNMGTFYGGGMYNNNSSPVITNCILQNNMGTPGSVLRGGGMCNMNSASSSITNCIFDSNTAYFGSGIQNYNSSPTITDCIFQNNWAATDGGGMCNENSTPVMTDCIFQNNQAIFGAGVHNWKSSPIITGCIFQNNRVRDDLPSLYNGGGMYNYDSSPIITNSVFWHNSNYYGGGMYNHDSSPIITNSVFWYNSAAFGAAIYNDGSSPTVTYSDVQDGHTGEGNINSDPLFVNASAGDFHLNTGSPCIDAGNNSAPSLPTLDFEGDPRILPLWGTADMGADEYMHPAPSCYSWDVRYRIVGGQVTMNYSAAGMTPVKKIIPLSEDHGGYMTFKFCKEADNGSRLVVIPQDSWYMENITVENIMTGINMDLSIGLDSDAAGILYIEDSIGDVDVSSESVSGRTPVQIDTIGDGTTDAAGSMLIPMTLVGDFNTSVGQSGELPFGMIFTTGNTSNVVSIPENLKMDGATMTSDGVPFAEGGGVAPYAGTNGTITATGTGDCLGIRLVGIRIDFQFEMKLELEPMIPDGFYGDADQDGALSIGDYSLLRLMLFGKQPFNPGGDADQDGELSIGDYSLLRLMLFGKQANANRYESSYDFSSGWSSNRRAGSNSMSSLPLTLFDNFNTDPDGWIAGDAADYINISNTDGNVWTIAGSEGNYSMLQCMFSPDVSPNNITSIGVMLNGSAQTNSDVLQLWVWNCDTGSWRQIGNDFSMTTDIESYTAWTAWGKVYADYIDGDGHMYILANLNNVNQALNVDYIKLSAIW